MTCDVRGASAGFIRGGASHDVGTKSRDHLLSAQKRRHWKAFRSVRRYEKHGRLTYELSKLSRRLQQRCAEQAELPDLHPQSLLITVSVCGNGANFAATGQRNTCGSHQIPFVLRRLVALCFFVDCSTRLRDQKPKGYRNPRNCG